MAAVPPHDVLDDDQEWERQYRQQIKRMHKQRQAETMKVLDQELLDGLKTARGEDARGEHFRRYEAEKQRLIQMFKEEEDAMVEQARLARASGALGLNVDGAPDGGQNPEDGWAPDDRTRVDSAEHLTDDPSYDVDVDSSQDDSPLSPVPPYESPQSPRNRMPPTSIPNHGTRIHGPDSGNIITPYIAGEYIETVHPGPMGFREAQGRKPPQQRRPQVWLHEVDEETGEVIGGDDWHDVGYQSNRPADDHTNPVSSSPDLALQRRRTKAASITVTPRSDLLDHPDAGSTGFQHSNPGEGPSHSPASPRPRHTLPQFAAYSVEQQHAEFRSREEIILAFQRRHDDLMAHCADVLAFARERGAELINELANELEIFEERRLRGTA